MSAKEDKNNASASKSMFGIRIKVDPPSPEDLEELDRLFKAAHLMRLQQKAKRLRKEEPLAGWLLREHLLDKIKPPSFQDLFKP